VEQHRGDDALEPLFELLARDEDLRRGDFTLLADIFATNERTISNWHREIQHDESWRPSGWHCGRHCRLFDEEDKAYLRSEIDRQFPGSFSLVQNDDVRMVAREVWETRVGPKHVARAAAAGNSAYRVPNFACSDGWICDLKNGWQVSSRKREPKKRSVVPSIAKDGFVSRVRAMIEKYGAEHVVNVDETQFHMISPSESGWAAIGADGTHVETANNDKEGVTLLGIVSAAGDKFPLMLLGTGRTERCLARYALEHHAGEIWATYTENGWSTGKSMIELLTFIRTFEPFKPTAGQPKGCGIGMVLDMHASHRTTDFKNAAIAEDVELVFVPPGATDVFQPLDRVIYAPFKAIAKRLSHNYIQGEIIAGVEAPKVARDEMVNECCAAWRQLSRETVLKAWSLYTEDAGVIPVDVHEEKEKDDPRDGTFVLPPDEVEVRSSWGGSTPSFVFGCVFEKPALKVMILVDYSAVYGALAVMLAGLNGDVNVIVGGERENYEELERQLAAYRLRVVHMDSEGLRNHWQSARDEMRRGGMAAVAVSSAHFSRLHSFCAADKVRVIIVGADAGMAIRSLLGGVQQEILLLGRSERSFVDFLNGAGIACGDVRPASQYGPADWAEMKLYR
jgi:hypothetical protein